MNKVLLTGRLTKDVVTRWGQGEKPTCTSRFTVAVNRSYVKEGGQTADFISCVAFGKTAEFIDKYFRKGMKIDLVGRIETGNYTNKEGVKVYTTDVMVESVEFGESKPKSNSDKREEQTYRDERQDYRR